MNSYLWSNEFLKIEACDISITKTHSEKMFFVDTLDGGNISNFPSRDKAIDFAIKETEKIRNRKKKDF